jgi:hypothetical protein
MVVSIRYSTIKKKEAARIEYPAIRVTSFVSIVFYLTCTISGSPTKVRARTVYTVAAKKASDNPGSTVFPITVK